MNWDRRFELDVEYVEKVSFLMDVKIILKTLKKVFVRENIAEDTNKVEGNFAEIRRNQIQKGAVL